MRRCKQGEIEWLEFELLQPFPELVHGVFLRYGGVSEPPYDSLSLGGCEGNPEQIAENRRRVLQVLKLSELVSARECHGKQIVHVPAETSLLPEGFDGLITEKEDLALLITHADCQAAIFFDPVQRVIANIHCGWRGNVQNIYGETVAYFCHHFGSDPKDLLVCISPSLGPSRAEFIHYQQELPAHFYPFQVGPYLFDFWAISRMQLKNAGVRDAHIEIAEICTFLEERDFFSYRRDKKTGRHGTIIGLCKSSCDL